MCDSECEKNLQRIYLYFFFKSEKKFRDNFNFMHENQVKVCVTLRRKLFQEKIKCKTAFGKNFYFHM